MIKEQLDEYNAEMAKMTERLNRVRPQFMERVYQLKKEKEKDDPSSRCHLCDKPDCMSCANDFIKMVDEKHSRGEF